MVSARSTAVALAAFTLGIGGANVAAAQGAGAGLDSQPREQASTKFNPLGQRGVAPMPGAEASTKVSSAESDGAAEAPPASAAAAIAIAAGPPVETPPATPPASPVAVETVASTPAAGKTPLGLSGSAPDTPPALGVIGGGHGKGSRSVAPTPEPSTLLLMTAGLAGIYRLRRRR